MKGFKRLFSAVAVLAVTALTFVSCNRDSVAEDLDNRFDNSYWEGTITQTTLFKRRWDVSQYVVTNVTYLDLQFSYNANTYSSGTGVEYSYAQYPDGWYTFRNDFNFTVRTDEYYGGRKYQRYIDMWYANGDHMQIFLYTYSFGNSFTGYVINNGVEIGNCEFVKRSTWRPYDYYNNWNYYSRSRAAAEQSDSVSQN